MVMLDVVYNHFGPDGAYIHAFAKPFFREDIAYAVGGRPSTSARREVRDYFIAERAVLGAWNTGSTGCGWMRCMPSAEEDRSWCELAGTVRAAVEPGRHVHLVLEHENNRAALLEGPDTAVVRRAVGR